MQRYEKSYVVNRFSNNATLVDYDNVSKNIIEVEKRPALYEKSLNQYRDRSIKARLWQDGISKCVQGMDKLIGGREEKQSKRSTYDYLTPTLHIAAILTRGVDAAFSQTWDRIVKPSSCFVEL